MTPTEEHHDMPLCQTNTPQITDNRQEEDYDDDDTSSILSASSSDPSSLSSSDAEEDAASSDPETDLDADRHAHSTAPSQARAQTAKERSALREQLKAFLPQLRAANEALEPGAESAFEIVDGGAEGKSAWKSCNEGDINGKEVDGPYIEMDLGLGVLEEKRGDDAESSCSEDEGKVEDRDEDVLGRLMGQKRKGQGVDEAPKKVVIQEL